MPLTYYIGISSIVFFIGILGIIINRKNFLIIIMSIELMLLAVNMNLISSSVFLDDLLGQIFALFIIAIAGAESSIGLAIVVAHFHTSMSISIEKIKLLRS